MTKGALRQMGDPVGIAAQCVLDLRSVLGRLDSIKGYPEAVIHVQWAIDLIEEIFPSIVL